MGVISSSIYTYSAAEFFILRALAAPRPKNCPITDFLYDRLNSVSIPMMLTPEMEIMTAVRQLSFSYFPSPDGLPKSHSMFIKSIVRLLLSERKD